VKISRGDVYWVGRSGVSESDGSIPHPHVVIQDDLFNQSRIDTVIVCALTSHLGRAKEPGNVLLEPGEANLTRQSVILVAQVSSIPKTQLGEFIGSLSEARVDQVLTGLKFLQTSFLRDR
jgi:mRNA interferase MazF